MKRLILVTAGLVTSVVGLNEVLCLVSQAAPPANRATPAHIDHVPPSIILSSKPVDWRTPVVDVPPVPVRLKQTTPVAPQEVATPDPIAPAVPLVEPSAEPTTVEAEAAATAEADAAVTVVAEAAATAVGLPSPDAPSRLVHSPGFSPAADDNLQVDKLAATKSQIAYGAVRRAIEGTQQPSKTFADDLPQQRLVASAVAHRSGSISSHSSSSHSSTGGHSSVPRYPTTARYPTPPPASHASHAPANYRSRTSTWGATRADRAKVTTEAMRWDPLATPHPAAPPTHPAPPSIPERIPTSSSPTPRPMRTASYGGQRSPTNLPATFSPTTPLSPPTFAIPSHLTTEESRMQARVEQHRAAAASIIQQTRPTTANPLVTRPPAPEESSVSPPGRMLDKRPPVMIPQPSPRRVAKSLSDRTDDSE